MRIRILKPSAGIIEGVSLSYLMLGMTYEVSGSLGAFLIGNGAAEELVSPAAAPLIPLDSHDTFHHITGGVTVVQDRAADTLNIHPPPKKR
jgi:hypothetical protein